MIPNQDTLVTVEPVQTGNAPALDERGAPVGDGIFLYGAGWCGDTRRSRHLLDRLAIPYTDVDVEADAAAATWAAAQNGGQRRIPVLFLPSDPLAPTILIEPSDDDLLAALRRTGYLVAVTDRVERAVDGGTEAAP